MVDVASVHPTMTTFRSDAACAAAYVTVTAACADCGVAAATCTNAGVALAALCRTSTPRPRPSPHPVVTPATKTSSVATWVPRTKLQDIVGSYPRKREHPAK